MESNFKTAVVLVSLGSIHVDSPDNAIGIIESRIRSAIAPIPVFHAFTSNRVIATFKRESQIDVMRPSEMLKHLVDSDFNRIVVQPLYVIPGFEFEKLEQEVGIIAQNYPAVIGIGRPLLSQQQDYYTLIEALELEMKNFLSGDAILWMGHGTVHSANSCYAYLERLWREKRNNVFIANIKGYPELSDILPNLRGQYKQICLSPLLISAGDHVKEDMLGDKDSFKSALEAEGLEVIPVVMGLGNMGAIQEIFVARVLEMVNMQMYIKD